MWLVTFSVACTITYQHKMHLVDGVTLTWLSDDGSTQLHVHDERSEYVQGSRQQRSQRETSVNIWIYIKPFWQSDFTYTGWTISGEHVNFMFHKYESERVSEHQGWNCRKFWREENTFAVSTLTIIQFFAHFQLSIPRIPHMSKSNSISTFKIT